MSAIVCSRPPANLPAGGCAAPVPRGSGGLTLPELLVGLAVLAALLALAVPGLASLLAAALLRGGSQDFVADLQFARAAAIARNARVVLCKGVGDGCTATGGWEQGWLVFEDANGNGVVDPGEEILRQRSALDRTLRMQGNATVSHYLAYSGSGVSRLNGGGFQAGTVTLCRRTEGATVGRQIVVNAVGRPRVQPVHLSACS